MNSLLIHLLGAEQQSAVSVARAYPEHRFVFFSDQRVVDGWDLPYVSIRLRQPGQERPADLAPPDLELPLCPRWLPHGGAEFALSRLLPDMVDRIPQLQVPSVYSKPPEGRLCLVKGNRFHRPDALLSGTAKQIQRTTDPNGCGLLFQDRIPETTHTILVMGRRIHAGQAVLGILQVLEERFFRVVILQSAETMVDPTVVDQSLAILDALDYRGFFALNWIAVGDGRRMLTSFRPVPRAAFGLLRHAGADLLIPAPGITIASAGFRMIADPTYTTYRGLTP
ncbi:MAG: hypothetical protein HQL55_17185 [Magnetococcales bacterium]|nr:hypothetical protein [Magnetococcales bacterium]